MKDVLILSIPIAGILVATYLMLQYFHNKSIHENEKEIDIQKTKTFFPLRTNGQHHGNIHSSFLRKQDNVQIKK